ncbi:spermidine/putrescine ABC transporter substrate-binding protein [Rhizobium sp. ARZ01]|uniref:polyamine ABC transporter substrate-binding protein n=1 Tax=Rhizobium sp. ARZ01 TaxID=2769313 RepID=UPI001781565E|nr:spermidine/putrescine ABC transporter substrate-binding protein [Rhizobium sp. ARZ01]MBD9371634.1 spermidine/putrescine ABC transporter substrate-binding protein [Rhizobium sp. ARZ01]
MRSRLISATMSLTVLLFPMAVRAETLNLLIWESYIDEAILKDWTAKTGVEVHQTYYDSGDARDEVLSDPNSDVDLVVTGENGAKLFGGRGILSTLSSENVPSLKEYDDSWISRCGGYGVPYLWGTMGILYRSDAFTTPPASWADLMLPAEALRNHIAMYQDHNEAFVPALVLLGKSINANDNETLKDAYQMMKAQAPFVLTYDYIITSIQNPEVRPKVKMALGYSGDQHVLNDKVDKKGLWRFSVPKEGTLSWLDCLSVSDRSPHKALALDLLNYIASATSAARNAQFLNMPTANREALARLPASIRDNPEIYPAPEILAKSQYQEELTVPSVQARRRIISSLVQFRDSR